ncbi:MAG: hypothetical protein JXR49_09745 [Acidobacteria bacterium]|nr:hypothetical protein [Acidobacteriota bacterium]
MSFPGKMPYILRTAPNRQIEDKHRVGRHSFLSFIISCFDNSFNDSRVPVSDNHGQAFLAQLQKNDGIHHKMDLGNIQEQPKSEVSSQK